MVRCSHYTDNGYFKITKRKANPEYTLVYFRNSAEGMTYWLAEHEAVKTPTEYD